MPSFGDAPTPGATSTSGATARERYGVDDSLLGIRGDIAVADLAAIRPLAAAHERGAAAGRPACRPARSGRSGSSTRSVTC